MSSRSVRLAASLCGFLGFAALGIYYSVPFPLPAPNATLDQLINDLRGYQNTIFFDAWLLATGSLLQVVFAIALVFLAGAASRFWGIFTILATAAILSVSLFDAAFTIAAVEAAANGHPATSLVCFDLTNSMRHVFLVAPSLFLPLGATLVGSRLLPRALGYSGLALGILFEFLGLATFFSPTAEAAIIGVLIGQELWMLAASIALAITLPQPE
jgi:small basic protein